MCWRNPMSLGGLGKSTLNRQSVIFSLFLHPPPLSLLTPPSPSPLPHLFPFPSLSLLLPLPPPISSPGDVESTEPTKMLMKIAEYVDTCEHEGLRTWFLSCKGEVLSLLGEEVSRVEAARHKATSVSFQTPG